MSTAPLLAFESITRRFGPIEALSGISFEIREGEIVGLVGENGAGKSTLMRIAARLLDASGGRVTGTARDSFSISMVHQHFNLVESFDVAENLTLFSPDAPFITGAGERLRIAGAMIDRAGLRTDRLERIVDDLSVGEKARLELTKALASTPQFLILDEPTGALTPAEVDELRTIVKSVQDRRGAVVLISHKIAEVFSFATRVVVLRKGEIALDRAVGETSPSLVAEAMIGREARPVEVHNCSRGAAVLEVVKVSTTRRIHELPLRSASFEVREGEIVAILGVSGNGQRALARLLRGMEKAASGSIRIRDRERHARDLASAARIGHIAEDRTNDGLVGAMSIAENLALVLGSDRHSILEIATNAIERFRIQASSPEQAVETLSGGNQQKVLLARELLREPELFVLSEPTRGLDFESTSFVRSEIRRAASRGCAVLLMTSDSDEAFQLADRFHVMFDGSLSESLTRDEVESSLGRRMGGLS